MLYKKINLELIVAAEDVEATVAALNAAMDRLEEEGCSLFGGEIEATTATIEPHRTRRKSALMHTLDAGVTAATALRMAREKVAGALRVII